MLEVTQIRKSRSNHFTVIFAIGYYRHTMGKVSFNLCCPPTLMTSNNRRNHFQNNLGKATKAKKRLKEKGTTEVNPDGKGYVLTKLGQEKSIGTHV